MKHSCISGIFVCPLPMTRSPSPEISTCFTPEFDHLSWHSWTWWLTLPVGAHTIEDTEFVFSPLASPNIIGVFFPSSPFEPGACICIDQVVRSRIRVIEITWEKVYKLRAQCPEHSGDLIQFHSYPPSLTCAKLHVEAGLSLLPFSVLMCFTFCHQHFFPAPWNWVCPPGHQSSLGILSSASHSSQPDSPLGFSSRNRTKLPQAEPTPLSPTPHSSLTSFIDKRVLLHFSVGWSLDYKWEWFNLYFRGREYLGFLGIFSP